MKIIIASLLILLVACNRNPHLKADLKSNKVSDACGVVSSTFKLTSNIAGERYEFQKCLPANFTGKGFEAKQHGDTVVVKFPSPGTGGATFDLTLDIDAYPDYHFITIDGETYPIGKAN